MRVCDLLDDLQSVLVEQEAERIVSRQFGAIEFDLKPRYNKRFYFATFALFCGQSIVAFRADQLKL
jgi:hypothetical protein